ncbi:MAG TPA: SNF2-related protein, partial [Longimicrobiales bacterium]|nr:SNF2-related protein [Longimicrobiales bacterium]
MLERLFPEDVRRAARAGRTFPLADFQEAAVTRARAVMRTRGGVVIADDVGLGKSYVALALVEEALCAGQEAALIVPASLRPMWRRLLSGLEGRERVHLATHTQLSRGSHPVGVARASLLVVDEAHAYRNPRTRRYRTLLELCAGARVAMLTATPVNNDPADLANLVRLFAADDAFRDVGVSSLRGLVRRQRAGRTGSAAGEARRSAGDVRRVAQHVVVRRTWELISGADDTVRVGGKALSLPRREPPEIVTYRDPWTPAAVRLIENLELGFQGPATGPRGGASDLLRLALLKRLDSGRAAIEVSLRRLLRLLERVRDGA